MNKYRWLALLVTLTVPALTGCGKDGGGGDSSKAASGSDGPTVASVVEDVKTNPAKYDNKPIKLTGLYMSTTSMTVNGKKSFNVSIVQSKETWKDVSLACEMGETEPPKDLKQYAPITVEGKGKVANTMKGDKQFKSLRLTECKIVK